MSRPSSIRFGLVAGAAVLLTTAFTSPAQARVTTAEGTAVTCTMDVGTVTATGDHTYHHITAGSPPTVARSSTAPAQGSTHRVR